MVPEQLDILKQKKEKKKKNEPSLPPHTQIK
jgi:hypothetical protein